MISVYLLLDLRNPYPELAYYWYQKKQNRIIYFAVKERKKRYRNLVIIFLYRLYSTL